MHNNLFFISFLCVTFFGCCNNFASVWKKAKLPSPAEWFVWSGTVQEPSWQRPSMNWKLLEHNPQSSELYIIMPVFSKKEASTQVSTWRQRPSIILLQESFMVKSELFGHDDQRNTLPTVEHGGGHVHTTLICFQHWDKESLFFTVQLVLEINGNFTQIYQNWLMIFALLCVTHCCIERSWIRYA